MKIHIQVLHVAECPNTPILMSRLAEVVAGRADVHLDAQLVHDLDQAIRLGMAGSPTLLVDSRDPFAQPGQSASLSCRLYRDPSGALTGAPTLAQLHAVIPARAG